MATTVLEELLIKVGIAVDSDAVKKATDAGKQIASALSGQASKAAKDLTNAEKNHIAEKEKIAKAEHARWQNIDAEKKHQDTQEKTRFSEIKRRASETETAFNKAAEGAKRIGMHLKTAANWGAGLVTAATAYTVIANNKSVESLRLSRSTGIDYNKIQELEYAAKKEGAAAGEMQATLEALNKAKGELQFGRGPLQELRQLGVSVTGKNGELVDEAELFFRIADNLKGFRKDQVSALLGQMGFSREMIQTLQKGREGLTEYMAEARKHGYVSQEQAVRMEKLNRQWVQAKQDIHNALIPMRMWITEIGIKWVNRISEWISRNKFLAESILKIALVTALVLGPAAAFIILAGNIAKAVVSIRSLLAVLGLLKGAGFAGILGSLGTGGTAAAGAGIGAIAGAVASTTAMVLLIAGAIKVAWDFGQLLARVADRIFNITGTPQKDYKPLVTGGEVTYSAERIARQRLRGTAPLNQYKDASTSVGSQAFTFNITGVQDDKRTVDMVMDRFTNLFRADMVNQERRIH